MIRKKKNTQKIYEDGGFKTIKTNKKKNKNSKKKKDQKYLTSQKL